VPVAVRHQRLATMRVPPGPWYHPTGIHRTGVRTPPRSTQPVAPDERGQTHLGRDLDACRTDQYSDHIVRTINATQAKSTFLALLDDVTDGEEIEITRHGRTIARLVPARGPAALRGKYAGLSRTLVEDEELLFSTGERWNAQE